MCLRWQVAIVHNVLMLTKCQFDPWDRRVGRGCSSWILKRATARCSCGDGRRHNTDETSNYLPNGRQIQGGKEVERKVGGREMKREEDSGKDRWWPEYCVRKRHKMKMLHLFFTTGKLSLAKWRFSLSVFPLWHQSNRVTFQASHNGSVAIWDPGITKQLKSLTEHNLRRQRPQTVEFTVLYFILQQEIAACNYH